MGMCSTVNKAWALEKAKGIAKRESELCWTDNIQNTKAKKEMYDRTVRHEYMSMVYPAPTY